MRSLGACPSNSMGRVPSAVPSAARRRDAGHAAAHGPGAATPPMPARRRNPEGAWGVRAISSFLVVGDAPGIAASSRLDLAAQAPCARPMLLLGHAPSVADRQEREIYA